MRWREEMTRIPVVSEAEATGTVKTVYEAIRRGLGRVTPAFQAMSLDPDYLEAVWNLHSTVMREGDIPRRDKEMIAVAVSAANRCEYCIAVHSSRLRALETDRAAVNTLAREPDRFGGTAREEELVRFALRVTRSPASIGDADVEALRRVGLGHRAILEVTAVAAHFNMINRFLDAMDVKPVRQ